MKTCSRCRREKELSEYGSYCSKKDGLDNYCLECRRAKNREWHAKNREKSNASSRRWRAENPEWWINHHLKRQAEGWYAEYYQRNKDHQRDQLRKWRQQNPDKAREQVQRRRAAKLSAPVIESIDREYIYMRDGGRCHICGKKVPHPKMTIDHLVPISKGGEHSHRNLRVAHLSCNSRRGAGRLPAQLLLVP